MAAPCCQFYGEYVSVYHPPTQILLPTQDISLSVVKEANQCAVIETVAFLLITSLKMCFQIKKIT